MINWISIKERKPENPGEYLASRKCRPRGWVTHYNGSTWVIDDMFPVTHWAYIDNPQLNKSKKVGGLINLDNAKRSIQAGINSIKCDLIMNETNITMYLDYFEEALSDVNLYLEAVKNGNL